MPVLIFMGSKDIFTEYINYISQLSFERQVAQTSA
jgi:hypothetical protein